MKTNRDMANLIYPRLSYEIMAVLFKVHNELGPTHQEKHYQKAIEEEFNQRKIPYQREYYIPLLYENTDIGRYFVDFIIDERIVLEVKTVRYFHPKYINQVLSYLNTLQLKLAILANFRKNKLEYKRIVLPDKYLKSH